MAAFGFAAIATLEVASTSGSATHAVVAVLGAVGAAIAALAMRPERAPELAALRRGLEALRGFDAAVLVLSDPVGRIVSVNDAAEEAYGRRRAELLSMRLEDLRHPTAPLDDGPGPEGTGRDGANPFASIHERGDGAPFPVEISTRALVLDGASHALSVIRDVTEQRLAEAALSEGVEQHRAVFGNVPMVQISLDGEGRITLVAGRGLEELGLSAGELLGRSIFEVAKEVPDLLSAFVRALGGSIFSGTCRIRRHVFDVHWSPLVRDDGTIRGATGVGLDVTARVAAERARKETEARLVAAERLASMGRLAAGVAHEINNPLTWVMSSLEAAGERARHSGAGPELEELLADATSGAIRVRDIVRDLRVFARSEAEGSGGCDAGAVARISLAMVRNELRHRARVETRFEPALPVAIPERQLGQVLVNLFVNAAHAIGDGPAEGNVVGVAVCPEGEGVRIEVRDSGCGMTPEVRERIFEPFFTTKHGEGMGLGLSLCQTMVQEAGGRISVESAPGRGSTFRIWLPSMGAASALLTPAPAAIPPPRPEAPRAATGGVRPLRSRLLVVDDEPLVGKTVARALPEHDVEYVADAREALARIHGGSRYDALVCDLMMPEMTGMELAQRLADEAHALAGHMLFLTGGAFTERAQAFVALTRAPVLEKPFEQGRLREGVARAIGGA